MCLPGGGRAPRVQPARDGRARRQVSRRREARRRAARASSRTSAQRYQREYVAAATEGYVRVAREAGLDPGRHGARLRSQPAVRRRDDPRRDERRAARAEHRWGGPRPERTTSCGRSTPCTCAIPVRPPGSEGRVLGETRCSRRGPQAAGSGTTALRARERAVGLGREACERESLQFLDETVLCTRTRPARDADGRVTTPAHVPRSSSATTASTAAPATWCCSGRSSSRSSSSPFSCSEPCRSGSKAPSSRQQAWTEWLFSIKVDCDLGSFEAGQFAKLALAGGGRARRAPVLVRERAAREAVRVLLQPG